jgi:hypothetical protein
VIPARPSGGTDYNCATAIINTGYADTGWEWHNVETTEEAIAIVQGWEDAHAAQLDL